MQVHEQHDSSMVSRTTGAVALGPTGNIQGGFYFFSLVSGRCLNWARWTELPVTHDVIERVNDMGRSCRAPRSLTFGDRTGMALEEPIVPIVHNDDGDDDDEP